MTGWYTVDNKRIIGIKYEEDSIMFLTEDNETFSQPLNNDPPNDVEIELMRQSLNNSLE